MLQTNQRARSDEVLDCKEQQRSRNSQDAYGKGSNQVEAYVKPEKSPGYVHRPYPEKRNQGSKRHLAKMFEAAGKQPEYDIYGQQGHSKT